MGNYYCLMAGLPDIELTDTKPGFSIAELREQCDETLSASDAKLLADYFYLRQDCKNLVKLLKDPNAEIDEWGNYSMEQYQDLDVGCVGSLGTVVQVGNNLLKKNCGDVSL